MWSKIVKWVAFSEFVIQCQSASFICNKASIFVETWFNKFMKIVIFVFTVHSTITICISDSHRSSLVVCSMEFVRPKLVLLCICLDFLPTLFRWVLFISSSTNLNTNNCASIWNLFHQMHTFSNALFSIFFICFITFCFISN